VFLAFAAGNSLETAKFNRGEVGEAGELSLQSRSGFVQNLKILEFGNKNSRP
jgi:hypothetical protein